MEQLKLSIPIDFIWELGMQLTWRELEFGIESELLDPKAPVLMAQNALLESPASSEVVVSLAIADKENSTAGLVKKLSNASPDQTLEDIKYKWLYIVLSWVYVRRDHVPDLLEIAERIYADWDYPPVMIPFVRYMPPDGPQDSPEVLENRMIERWKLYLDREAAKHQR